MPTWNHLSQPVQHASWQTFEISLKFQCVFSQIKLSSRNKSTVISKNTSTATIYTSSLPTAMQTVLSLHKPYRSPGCHRNSFFLRSNRSPTNYMPVYRRPNPLIATSYRADHDALSTSWVCPRANLHLHHHMVFLMLFTQHDLLLKRSRTVTILELSLEKTSIISCGNMNAGFSTKWLRKHECNFLQISCSWKLKTPTLHKCRKYRTNPSAFSVACSSLFFTANDLIRL